MHPRRRLRINRLPSIATSLCIVPKWMGQVKHAESAPRDLTPAMIGDNLAL